MNSHNSVTYIHITFIAVSGGKNQECKECKDLNRLIVTWGRLLTLYNQKKSSGEYNIARVF